MSHVFLIQEWETFAKEADRLKEENNLARLDVVIQPQQTYQVATIQTSVLDKRNNAFLYEETIGVSTDPNSVLSEESKKAANEELKELAEKTKKRREEVKKTLKELGYTVYQGVIKWQD